MEVSCFLDVSGRKGKRLNRFLNFGKFGGCFISFALTQKYCVVFDNSLYVVVGEIR